MPSQEYMHILIMVSPSRTRYEAPLHGRPAGHTGAFQKKSQHAGGGEARHQQQELRFARNVTR